MATFGFSVGDFITCLKLIRDVTQAMNDSKGSSSEYQSLFHTLDSLNQALIYSELIYHQWDTQIASSVYKKHATAMINGICFERRKCSQLIESFLKSSQSYTDAFIKERGRAIIRNWRKVTWVFQKEEVKKFEKELQRHLQALRIYTDAFFQYECFSSIYSDAHTSPEIKLLQTQKQLDGKLRVYLQMSPIYEQTYLGWPNLYNPGFLPKQELWGILGKPPQALQRMCCYLMQMVEAYFYQCCS
ncbi:hypothetical protein B0O99DRAFT_157229 [Bisporella sp. PMI_857]|nr:hypothetical protein B0O99DRAFT_157229 [Bisporella sp. PMI_857]